MAMFAKEDGTGFRPPFFFAAHIYSMASQTKIIRRAFNAGETSKAFKWRNDTEKHAYSCEKLENFYVSPLGSIYRRKGTKLLSVIGSEGDEVRIVPFEYNRNFSRLLVFRPGDGQNYNYTYPESEFGPSEDFSFCIDIPEGFAVVGEVMRKNPYTLVRSSNGIWTFSSDKSAVSFSLFESNAQKIAIVRRNGELRIYKGDTQTSNTIDAFDGGNMPEGAEYPVRFGASQTFLREVPASGENIIKVKIFNYDISQELDDSPFYSMADWLNGEEPAQTFSSLPTWGEQSSKLGSAVQYSDGNLTLDFDRDEILEKARISFENSISTGDRDALREICNQAHMDAQIYSLGYIPGGPGGGSTITDEERLTYKESAISGVLGALEKAAEMYGFNSWEDFYEYCLEYYPTDRIFDGNAGGLGFYAKEYIEQNFDAILPWLNIPWRIAGSSPEEVESNIANGRFYFPMRKFEDEISVPFYAPKFSEISFDTPEMKGARLYAKFKETEEAEGPEETEAELSLGAPKSDVSHLLVKLDFEVNCKNPEEDVLPSISGAFNISAAVRALLTGQEDPLKERTKVVVMDVYSVDGGKPLQDSIATPIPQSSLQGFQYKQAGGWLYIAHSDFPPVRFAVDSNGNFGNWENAAEFYPSENEPVDVVVNSNPNFVDDIYYAGDSFLLQSDKDFFNNVSVGDQFKIEYDDIVDRSYSWIADAGGSFLSSRHTEEFPAQGIVEVIPEGGIWDGALILEESTDGGASWREIGRSESIEGTSNTSFSREIYNAKSVVRVKTTNLSRVQPGQGQSINPNQDGCLFTIRITGTFSTWCNVVSVVGNRTALVEAVNPCRQKFKSAAVFKSAWNKSNGYPRAVEIHEERLVFAGTNAYPSAVWLSQTNNWTNFRSISNLDSDPLSYTLASDDGEPISWLISRQDLMIGMGSSEWSLGSRDAGQALTASIVHAANQSEDGVEYIMPTKAGGMVIYVRRGNREVGSISYDFASDAYNSICLTTMNPQIMGKGFKCIFNQLSPRNQIFALREDGQLAVFTYDKENNVAAWSRMTFGEGVEGACAMSAGLFKSVFLTVKRNGYLCLERLDPNEEDGDGVAEKSDWLDCVPISDSIEVKPGLETEVNYESLMKTTPVFLEGNIRVVDVKMYLLNSLGGRFRVSGFDQNGGECADDWRDILPRESEFLQNPQPRDYRYLGSCDTGYLEEASIEISTDSPAPFELAALAINAKG